MENIKLEKIKRSAGVTAKVLKAVRIILMVGMILAFVGGISTMAFRIGDDGKTVEVFGKSITVHGMVSFGDLSIHRFDILEGLNIEDPFTLAGLNCFVAAAICAMAMVAVILLERTFKSIETSDTPFRAEILNRIRLAGILVTLITLSASIGVAAIVGLTFWCLYCIFDYGTELQQGADETL